MKIKFIVTGRTEDDYVKAGINHFSHRIKKYTPFEILFIPVAKYTGGTPAKEQVKRESDQIRKAIGEGDVVVLLDEHGKEMTSREFSGFLQKKFLSGKKSLLFIAGGAYGFDEELKRKASQMISLSRMTFPHQLVRVIFLEQLYRALTILKHEPYHHD